MLKNYVLSLALFAAATSAIAGNVIRVPISGIQAPAQPPPLLFGELTMEETSLDFYGVVVGESSRVQSVTVINRIPGPA